MAESAAGTENSRAARNQYLVSSRCKDPCSPRGSQKNCTVLTKPYLKARCASGVKALPAKERKKPIRHILNLRSLNQGFYTRGTVSSQPDCEFLAARKDLPRVTPCQ